MREAAPEQATSSDDDLRRRKRRSLAIALTLAALVALFYALTIAKLGPGVFQRAL